MHSQPNSARSLTCHSTPAWTAWVTKNIKTTDWRHPSVRDESIVYLQYLQQHVFSSQYKPCMMPRFMGTEGYKDAIKIEFVIEKGVPFQLPSRPL